MMLVAAISQVRQDPIAPNDDEQNPFIRQEGSRLGALLDV
jgi:hypothetical protein